MGKFYTGMNGGKKQLWLRLHKAEVLEYYDKHGRESTQREYNLKPKTLDSLLLPGSKRVNESRFTKVDKALVRVEIVEECLRELRHEQKEMLRQYREFVPLVASQLRDNFLMPLLAGTIKLPPELELGLVLDPLSLADF